MGRDALRDRWSRWTAIVALFARQRPARRRVDPGTYEALRGDLMQVCRARAAAEEGKRGYYLGLEDMVRPWIDLRVLDRTDREILAALLRRCHEVERHLAGGQHILHWPSHLGRGSVIAIAVAGVVLCVAGILRILGYSLIEIVHDAALTLWLNVKYADAFYQMATVAAVVVIVAIFTVSRSARAWR
jgi:hypothetical protein